MSLHTFGASFGATGYQRDAELRAKADAANATDESRLARLPKQCRQWSDRLDVDALEAMAVVAKDYEREGMAPVRVSTSDIARALKIDAAGAEARLERCIRAGAVQRTRRLAADPVFTPLARGTVAEKADPLAELRNVVDDCRAKIEGRPVPQRAKAESSMFQAGTLMGLQRRT